MSELIVLSARECDKKHQGVSYNTILGLENEFINICGDPIVLLSNKIDGLNRICNQIFKRRLLVDNRAVSKIEKVEVCLCR